MRSHGQSFSAKERASPQPDSRHRIGTTVRADFEMAEIHRRSEEEENDDDDEAMALTREELGYRHSSQQTRQYEDRWKDAGGADATQENGILKLNLADAKVVKHLAVNTILIGCWYTFSLSISLYNQWMFSGRHLNFQFPLFTTCMHMLVQFVLASLVLYFFPRFRPQRPASSSSSSSSQGGDRPLMTRYFYITRIGPCGAATGLDIGLGNTSMRFITLTFYTMCKSSVLGFVLLFAFVFGLERPSVKLLGIIAVMTVGVILMVAGETSFDLAGFLLIMSASCFSGFRWALTQILLLRSPATGNPFSSLFFLAPVMFATLLVIAIPAEGIAEVGAGLADLAGRKGTVAGAALLLFPGTLAFCMTASEFALLKRTSVVTLSVAGIFKEVVTIVAAQSTLDHDRMTPVNLAGLAVTIASIATYNYIKIRRMRADAEQQVRDGRDPQVGILPVEPLDAAAAAAATADRDEAARPMLADHQRREEEDYDGRPPSPRRRPGEGD